MGKKKDFTTFFIEKLPSPNIIELYGEIIAKNKKIKKVKLPGKKGNYTISRTLFGYMVEKNRTKIPSSDINHAKYLKIFSEMGLKEILIPESVNEELINSLEKKYLEIENKIREIFPFTLKRRIIKKHKNKIFKEIKKRIEDLNNNHNF